MVTETAPCLVVFIENGLIPPQKKILLVAQKHRVVFDPKYRLCPESELRPVFKVGLPKGAGVEEIRDLMSRLNKAADELSSGI